MSTTTFGRRSRRLVRMRRPSITGRQLLGAGLLVLALFGGWLWFRSSSIVAIKQVRVSGLSGPDVRQIRTALTDAARGMTTLNVSTQKLEAAVAGYSHIAGIHVSTSWPHGVRIAVDERIPVAVVSSDGHAVAVDGNGLLLAGTPTRDLPRLSIAPDTAGARVIAPGTLATLAVLSSAPYQLLGHIVSARSGSAHGVSVQLRNGPVLYFGDTTQLTRKWQAAVATLASADSVGASYIDVSAPGRPAAGTGH